MGVSPQIAPHLQCSHLVQPDRYHRNREKRTNPPQRKTALPPASHAQHRDGGLGWRERDSQPQARRHTRTCTSAHLEQPGPRRQAPHNRLTSQQKRSLGAQQLADQRRHRTRNGNFSEATETGHGQQTEAGAQLRHSQEGSTADHRPDTQRGTPATLMAGRGAGTRLSSR